MLQLPARLERDRPRLLRVERDQLAVLLVTDVYPAGEKPIEGATGEELADAIRAHGHRAVSFVRDKKQVASALADIVEPGDLVIALGAGDINASARELLAALERERCA